jgi:hypothetical protein
MGRFYKEGRAGEDDAMRKKKAVKSARRAVKVAVPAAVADRMPGDSGAEGPLVSAVLCPVPTDPAMGDKTPGVMAWYRENRPEEYKRRYGNRVCPVVDDEAVRMRKGVGCAFGDVERGPVSDFEEEDEVMVKPRVIMG